MEDLERKMIVHTKAGDIIVEKTVDPGAPGFWISWVPAGRKLEIEIAHIEVKEDREYQHIEEDSEENVALYLFENVASEEWTKRCNFLRSDIDELFVDGLSSTTHG